MGRDTTYHSVFFLLRWLSLSGCLELRILIAAHDYILFCTRNQSFGTEGSMVDVYVLPKRQPGKFFL